VRPRARPATVALPTAAAMACFAANSLLARAALGRGLADAGTFTGVRIVSGAAVLAILAALRPGRTGAGSWGSAAALAGYALAFSLAYLRIGAGTGAFLLFAAVQVTMIGGGLREGRRPSAIQWAGVALALSGLALLARPGRGGGDLAGAALMAAAGVAWGVYSLRGRGAGDPVHVNAGNFARAAVLAAGAGAAAWSLSTPVATAAGVLLAAASGAVASAGGYSLWYAALPSLGPTRAAAVQLSAPVIAAAAGVVLLGEAVTPRSVAASGAILGGVALALRERRTPPARRARERR